MRGALLAVALAAGVIIGLLAMHGFDAHGRGMHAGAPAAVTAHDGVAHHAGAMGAHEAASAAVAAPEPRTATAAAPDCASCGAGATAAACVLALLAAVLLLLLPRGTPWRGAPRPWSAGVLRPLGIPAPSAPSFHVLCISRR